MDGKGPRLPADWKSTLLESRPALRFWSICSGWLVVLMLFVAPPAGLFTLWKLLIPVAPLLLFLAPGLWRQICPLGSVAVLPRELGWRPPSQAAPSARLQARLRWVGAAGLLLIPPLRPLLLDGYGPLTGAALLLYALAALYLGYRFTGRGAFCNALCPVHFVELMYGQFSRPLRLPVRCGSCEHCSPACADVQEGAAWGETAGLSLYAPLASGFPGFVAGWFLIPQGLALSPESILLCYALPLGGFALSCLFFTILGRLAPKLSWSAICSLLALGLYYWFQLPRIGCAWFGFACG